MLGAPQALAAALPALALVVASVGCAAGVAARPTPLLELGFAAGARVDTNDDDEESSLVAASASAGAMWWQERGEAPPMQSYLGLGCTFIITWFDLERTDLGLDLVLAPPRADRRNGFQFRVGPRLSSDGEHGGVSFSAEWSDSWVGGLFAETQYDFGDAEASFLFGARVNLFFPITYVRATAVPLE